MLLSTVILFSLFSIISGIPSLRHVQHEKRDSLPRGWRRTNKLPTDEVLPMRIALAQSNIHRADEYLMEVSHPDSPGFGKHWTAQQVAETFAPSKASVDAVADWLKSAGISRERISSSQSMGWLTFDATVGQAEELLKTKFFRHEHTSGKPHIACDNYHIPEHLKPHVDFITPTVHFDTKVNHLPNKRAATPNAVYKRATSTGAEGHAVTSKAAVTEITNPYGGSLPKKGVSLGLLKEIATELENCDEFIVPDCLRALYKFPRGFSANRKNSLGIVEYTPQAFLQDDLDLFFSNFSRRQRHKTPIEDFIDGATLQTTQQGFQFNGESALDLEYAMTLINPQQVTLYQVGDLVEGASFNNFLDAIDGSYCTFEGGDDKTQDAAYPDPFGGYQGPENCGGFAATKVISTSYDFNEADLTPLYEKRQCAEYLKLGLQGTSILYSSGDFGVAGNLGQCITSNGTYNNGTTGKFNPSFPSTCPYVTSVGATQISPGASVTAPESACETVIFSGGGFSNVFALPEYQAAAVTGFLKNHPPPYNASLFNSTGKSRGYPDISANGANYVIAADGVFSLVYGTSASTPVVGAILTLINEARFDAGKGSVGFVNPTLYANPGLLNDVTSGGNQGCGTKGFTASEGWDPVTGLGTPNFPRLLEKFLSLP